MLGEQSFSIESISSPLHNIPGTSIALTVELYVTRGLLPGSRIIGDRFCSL